MLGFTHSSGGGWLSAGVVEESRPSVTHTAAGYPELLHMVDGFYQEQRRAGSNTYVLCKPLLLTRLRMSH